MQLYVCVSTLPNVIMTDYIVVIKYADTYNVLVRWDFKMKNAVSRYFRAFLISHGNYTKCEYIMKVTLTTIRSTGVSAAKVVSLHGTIVGRLSPVITKVIVIPTSSVP